MKVSELTTATAVNSSDSLMIVQNGVSKKVTLATMFANVPSPIIVSGPVAMNGPHQTITNSGVINVSTAVTIFTTDVLSVATIDDGLNEGQIKIVLLENAGATLSLSGDNVGVTSVVFATKGTTCILQWLNNKWYPIGGTATIS